MKIHRLLDRSDLVPSPVLLIVRAPPFVILTTGALATGGTDLGQLRATLSRLPVS